MSIQKFLFGTLILLLLCINISSCNAQKSQNCHITSSCGHIHNISFPFRLKTDPRNCGDPSYELACKNNQTILYNGSMEFYVQNIDYEKYTIRLLDPGIRKNGCPSLPFYPLPFINRRTSYVSDFGFGDNNYVAFILCPSQVESSFYVDTASCSTENTSLNTSSYLLKEYNYVVVGNDLKREGLKNSCMIRSVVLFSSEFSITNKTSFSSIIDTMTNGFTIMWFGFYCRDCNQTLNRCFLNLENHVTCSPRSTLRHYDSNYIGSGIYEKLWGIWQVLAASTWGGKLQVLDPNLNPRLSRKGLLDIPLIFTVCVSNLTALILLPRFLCGFTCLLILVICKYRRRHLSNDENIEEFLQGQINLLPIRYSYADIRKMTKKFKDKLGEGGYGSVFKGKLRSGHFVAVKIMNQFKASGQEFINEVATIGTIHHVNVVQLIGFCVEGSTRALIYEFMPNGSLDKYIFSQEDKTLSLSYEKMFEISLGVARGIDYLHRGCEMQILHFDIKPHNILLDENFNPKISDFGLAKLYSTDDSIVSLTAARGTMGYMAPELFYKNIGGVSYKADVYSYGMLIMEMAGRRKNLNPFLENLSQIYFPSWVYDQFNEGKDIATENVSREEKKIVKKMILVGLWCIQMKPIERPSMNKIVEMLEGDDQHMQMPPKPSLYPEESPADLIP